MKTPKEKAIDIYLKMLKWQDDVDKYYDFNIINTTAKQCALIAVDDILDLMIKEFKWCIKYNGNIEYYQEVKEEIENL